MTNRRETRKLPNPSAYRITAKYDALCAHCRKPIMAHDPMVFVPKGGHGKRYFCMVTCAQRTHPDMDLKNASGNHVSEARAKKLAERARRRAEQDAEKTERRAELLKRLNDAKRAEAALAEAAKKRQAEAIPTGDDRPVITNGPTLAEIRKLIDEAAGQITLDVESKVDETMARKIGAKVLEQGERIVDKVTKRIEETMLGGTKPVILTFPNGANVSTKGEHPKFRELAEEVGMGHRVLLVGPAGSGKTYATEQLAKKLEMAYFVCTPVDMRAELLGYRDLKGEVVKTQIRRWAEHEGAALLVIDELDRFHPRALLALNALLANGYADFPDGAIIIDGSKAAVGTANTFANGAGAVDYVGALKQDGAVLNRFVTQIEWNYDARVEKTMCVNAGGDLDALKRAIKIRKALKKEGIRIIWGPRDTVAVAKRVAFGLSFEDAVGRSCLSQLDGSQLTRVLRSAT